MASSVRPASAGSGVVHANWCSSGVSGKVRPTIAATRGPQMPAQQTTMSASISP